MSKRWRARLIVYGLLALGLSFGSWYALEHAWPLRDPDKYGVRRDVVFVTTPPEVIDKMLELAAVTKDDVVYDLGSGDGRIVIAAAKKYGCKSVGWEIDPKLVDESRRNAEAAGVAHLVEIHQGDIFKVDLSGCTVLAVYLLPDLNVRLIPQIEKMKAGSRIVSFLHNMPGVRPKQAEVHRDQRGIDRNIFLWITPLQKD